MKRRICRWRATTMGSAWGAEAPNCTIDDDGRGSSDGHHRVHDDAQLAVIRVGLVGWRCVDLGNGQHRQQDKTDTSPRPARSRTRRRVCRGELS